MNTIKISIDETDFPAYSYPLPFEDFIFNEFKLCVEGIKGVNIHYVVEWYKETRDIVFENYENNIKIGRYQWQMSPDKEATRGTLYKCPPCPKFNLSPDFYGEEKDIALDAVKIILFHMGLIMNYPRDHKQRRTTSHRYSREHRISTTQNKIYLFDDIVKYVSEKYVPESGHYKVTCPCWEVRGHYRHYKSGKVIFVPAYRKGKDRKTAKPKDKEYYI